MTIVAVTYRYTDDVARRDGVLPQHRDWLRRFADQGVLLVSGPYGPDEPRGALLLFRAEKAQVRALLEKDPFAVAGVIARTEIAVWEPVIGSVLAAVRS
ncbi:hypothetical protein SRB17_67460 [Streptomyces sp. RB17]|uniref:YciI family protein n=1 Tax=Streptomyces sp. RB17 TaxID=2585197 RepID=UPI0012960E4C|nr:YciI family protein [Streptomyces sp. RB17]MQY38733.1 hypothetical protein [Streptomyces sp. RB17]